MGTLRRHRLGRAALALAAMPLTIQAISVFPAETPLDLSSNMSPANQPHSGLTSVGGMNMGSTKPATTSNADAINQSSPTAEPKIPKAEKLYFLLLFLLLFVAIAIFLVLRRRRIAKRRRARDSSQSALQRDIEGWAPARSWPGGWRSMVNRTSRTSRISREEGLDERGEAPPPYDRGRGEDAARALAEAEATAQARREAESCPLRSQDSAMQQMTPSSEAQVAIPLRTMNRWSASASLLPNPPEYESALLDGSERRRSSLGERIHNRDSGAADAIYQIGSNEIIEGRVGSMVEIPRQTALRSSRH